MKLRLLRLVCAPLRDTPPRNRALIKIGSWQFDLRLVRHGRCTAEACGYHNYWCPNGCPEHFDLDDPEPIAAGASHSHDSSEASS